MSIRELTLREMIIERILFAVDEDVLNDVYQVTEIDLYDLTDADLLDLFEDVTFDSGYGAGELDE